MASMPFATDRRSAPSDRAGLPARSGGLGR